MSGEKINQKPYQNGQYVFAGFEQAGLSYRPNPIESRNTITLIGFEKNKAKEINLANKLNHDFLITSISADIVGDDSHILQLDERSNYRFNYVQTIIQLLDRDNLNVLRTMSLFLSGYSPYLGELILSPKILYRVQTNQDVRSISLIGKPVYVDNPIVFS